MKRRIEYKIAGVIKPHYNIDTIDNINLNGSVIPINDNPKFITLNEANYKKPKLLRKPSMRRFKRSNTRLKALNSLKDSSNAQSLNLCKNSSVNIQKTKKKKQILKDLIKRKINKDLRIDKRPITAVQIRGYNKKKNDIFSSHQKYLKDLASPVEMVENELEKPRKTLYKSRFSKYSCILIIFYSLNQTYCQK